MQKIITYLYTNRIQLLAGLAGFNTEYTNVYQRNVKIYSGIDNTLEFDIKNADQKRVDLTTFSSLILNVMDISGNALPNTPYTLTNTSVKGIASVVIPASDLQNLTPQTLNYSVTGVQGLNQVILYTDSHFGALGILELIGSAVPVTKPSRLFDSFTGEIDYMGNVLNHSSAIPAKYYEAIPTTTLNFSIYCTNFVGTIYLEATSDQTISVESFRNSPQIQSWSTTVPTTSSITFSSVPIGDYCYFRIVWHNPLHGFTYGPNSPYNPGFLNNSGTVDKVIVS